MYYIDFDNTLFDTHKYGIELLSNLYETILQYFMKDSKDTTKVEIINTPTLKYFFLKAKELSVKYNIPYEVIETALKEILTTDTFTYKDLLEKHNIPYETLDKILFEKFSTNITNEELSKKYNIPIEILTDELINATKQDTSNYTKVLEKLYETAIQYILPKDKESTIGDSQNSNSTIANFFLMAHNLSQKYDVPYELLERNLISTMKNDSKFLFKDTLALLKSLKKSDHKICILTHVAQKGSIESDNTFLQSNLAQQAFKILGSEQILRWIDEIYITTLSKYTLDLDYEHNSFIDDSPDDLGGLFIRQHPDLHNIDNSDLQYINFKTLYNQRNCHVQIMNNLIKKIHEKTGISEEEINNQCSFNLDTPNFDIIIDCLSAKFKVEKQILYSIIDSTLKLQTYNLENIPQQQSDNDSRNNILASYGSSNLKLQLLTTVYSSTLPLAKGIFISNRTSKEIEQDKKDSKTPGKIYRFKGKSDYKRISKKVLSTKKMQLLYTNGKRLPYSEEIIPVYTSLLDIPIENSENVLKKED